ncbi:MAG: MBL fold metallo-hydrolase [Clostridia bacterium]|nr:MBL fold metallo-hydrolase [Clostridia bacterium]
MKFTWLGQGGMLFDNGRAKIIIDPYLSDSVEKINPKSFRRTRIDESIFDVRPDIMIFTHDHLDHFDPETAERFLSREGKAVTVFSPSSVWGRVRKLGGEHNYVQFNRGTEWTEGDIRLLAVYAEHSDPYAIGVVIEDLAEGRRYYVAGDTLYNRRIADELGGAVDVAFMPVNGVGNNMNMTDAARLAEKIGAKKVVPVHFGMFDELRPHGMQVRGLTVPTVYEQIEI